MTEIIGGIELVADTCQELFGGHLALAGLELPLNGVWDYLAEHNKRDTTYGGSTYHRWIRERAREEYLPEMVRQRFSGLQPFREPKQDRSLPQNFQHEVFGYLTETSGSKYGVLARLSYEDVTIDSDIEKDLQGLYYGVASAIAILDRAQTPSYSREDDIFPQVRTATIYSSINDGVFIDQWGPAFVDRILESRASGMREKVAQQVGIICAKFHAGNEALSSTCNYNYFVNASVVSTLLIIEQLGTDYYTRNKPRTSSC